MDFYILMTNQPVYIVLSIIFLVLTFLCMLIVLEDKSAKPKKSVFFSLLMIVCLSFSVKNMITCKTIEQKQASDFANVMVTRCNKFTISNDKYYLDTQDKDGNYVSAVLDNSLKVSVRKDLGNGYIDNRNKIIYLSENIYTDDFNNTYSTSLSNYPSDGKSKVVTLTQKDVFP